MPRKATPPERPTLFRDARTPWYQALIGTILIAVVAYFMAAFTFLIILYVSKLPHDTVSQAILQGPLLFILLILVVVLLVTPFFQQDLGSSVLRTFSLFAGAFLIAFFVFRDSDTHFLNAQNALDTIDDKVLQPLKNAVKSGLR